MDWATVYRMFVEKTQKGEPPPNFVRGGLAEGFVKMSAYGPAVPDAAPYVLTLVIMILTVSPGRALKGVPGELSIVR